MPEKSTVSHKKNKKLKFIYPLKQNLKYIHNIAIYNKKIIDVKPLKQNKNKK